MSELSLLVPGSISTVHLRSHRTGLALRAARGHHGRRRSGGASVSAPSARSGSHQGGSVAVGGRSEGGSRDLRSRRWPPGRELPGLRQVPRRSLLVTSTLAGSRVGGPPIGLRRRDGSGWTSLGLVRWDSWSIRLSPPRPRFRPGSRALLPSILRRRCRWVAALHLSIRGPRGELAASGGRWPNVEIRLRSSRGRPSFKAFIRRRVWYARTSVSGGGTYRFSHGLCFPFEVPLFPRLERCRARDIPPPVWPPVVPSVRASVPEDLLRNPRAAGVAPLRSLSGRRATARVCRPKPAAVLRRPPWGF